MRLIPIILSGAVLVSCTGTPSASLDKIHLRGSQNGDVLLGDSAGYYAHAKAQLAAGNPSLAIDGFRKALRIDPRSVDALNGLGAAYDRIGRYDLSRNYYEQALGLDPRSRITLNNFGYSLALQGKTAEAREMLAQAGASGNGAIAAIATQNLSRLADRAEKSATATPKPLAIHRSWVERLSVSTQLLITRLVSNVTAPELTSVSHLSADSDRPVRYSAEYHRQRLSLASSDMAEMASDQVTFGRMYTESVVVLNGVGRRGMAGRMAGFLTEKGYQETRAGNADSPLSQSEVIYPMGQEEVAAAVAALLPFQVELRASTKIQSVTLKLGSDARKFDDRLRSLNRMA